MRFYAETIYLLFPFENGMSFRLDKKPRELLPCAKAV